MGGNITYLFGAGASANTLPVVSEMANGLEKFLEIIQTDTIFNFSEDKITIDRSVVSRRELKDALCDTLSWLIKGTKEHASIDTFAKKLYLTVYLIVMRIIFIVKMNIKSFFSIVTI